MGNLEIVLFDDYKYKPTSAINTYCDDKTLWTDGRMMLKLEHLRGTIKRMFEVSSKYDQGCNPREESKRIIWDSAWGTPREKAGVSSLVRKNKWQESTVLLKTKSGERAIMSADKLKFLMMKVPSCSFHVSNDDPGGSPVTIMSGEKRVGVIMPMRP